MYNDLGLFKCLGFFEHREVLEAINEFNYLQYLTSTKSSAVLACFHGTSLEPLFVFAFCGVLCGNCN